MHQLARRNQRHAAKAFKENNTEEHSSGCCPSEWHIACWSQQEDLPTHPRCGRPKIKAAIMATSNQVNLAKCQRWTCGMQTQVGLLWHMPKVPVPGNGHTMETVS